ncbi:MAG: Ig-like domain-containing protein, partial [Clostridia bacterium]|nr:Ig-like domain-containing protein [Clostridia bacterium]
MKRLISLLLALVIIAGVIPAMTFSASALTVSTGNAYIDKYLNMAMSVEGKTKSYFGFNRAWCDLFIGWPAEKTGMTDIIPPMSKCNYGDGIGNYIATHGGSFVYFYDDVARDCDYGVKMKESDYTPKPGDIVFLRSSSNENMSSPTRWAHNAIVYKVTDSSIYVVHGNWSSQVVVGTRFSRTSAVRYGKYYRITGYARPAYPETSPDVEPENPILQVPGYMCVPDTTDNAVKLNITEATVPADLTCQIETTLPDEMADLDVTYTSGNTDVATVGENGLVTPVSEGETEITVKAGDDETTARTVKITVVKKVFDLLEAKPNDETAENYKEIFLHRYVYNEELKRDTLIEGEIPFRTDVSETEKVWSELKKTTTKPETSDELEIISTETSYNLEKWTAKTDISVYSDENMTEKVGTISSGETFSTYNRKIVSGNLVAETENGFIVVRTASSASKYATFIGTEFVTNEAWKTLTTLNVRSAPSTSGDYVTAYSKGTSVTVTEYSEDDKYLWGKTSKGWIALYNYSAAEYNAEKTSESSATTYTYREKEGKKTYVYLTPVGYSDWQIAELNPVGITTIENKTFYYDTTATDPEIDEPETD